MIIIKVTGDKGMVYNLCLGCAPVNGLRGFGRLEREFEELGGHQFKERVK